MGQPTPPGDNPLFEGVPSEWNDVISALPEDQRATFGPKIKERLSSYEPLKQWERFSQAGITPDLADVALKVYDVIEKDPRSVYDTLATHLGITPEQAKEVVKEVQQQQPPANNLPDDPRLQTMQQQIETMAKVMISQREQTVQEQQAQEADTAIANEIEAVKKKYGDGVNEEQVIMRMLHKGITAEQAHNEYAAMVTDIQKRRPAPFVLGSGGQIPPSSIDVKKLGHQDTVNLVAQMMAQGNNAAND
jgi:hypothetical protein